MVLDKEVEEWVNYLDAEQDCKMFIECFLKVMDFRDNEEIRNVN